MSFFIEWIQIFQSSIILKRSSTSIHTLYLHADHPKNTAEIGSEKLRPDQIVFPLMVGLILWPLQYMRITTDRHSTAHTASAKITSTKKQPKKTLDTLWEQFFA